MCVVHMKHRPKGTDIENLIRCSEWILPKKNCWLPFNANTIPAIIISRVSATLTHSMDQAKQ